MGQVMVFWGAKWLRWWSEGEGLHNMPESFARGARFGEVCGRRDVLSVLIYTWRHKLLDA